MNNQQTQEATPTFEQRHPEEDDALYNGGVAVVGIGSFAVLANLAVMADEYFEKDYYMLDQFRGTELQMIAVGAVVAIAGASIMQFARTRVNARLHDQRTAIDRQDTLLEAVFPDLKQLGKQSITGEESL